MVNSWSVGFGLGCGLRGASSVNIHLTRLDVIARPRKRLPVARKRLRWGARSNPYLIMSLRVIASTVPEKSFRVLSLY